MEELSRIAMGYYQASSDELQKLARDFFLAMDTDEDGKIDKKEFMEFMRDEGYAQMTNTSFFNQIDLDNNGTLDFEEVMTLYYIVKSRRPFCDCCKMFIKSTYLSCVGCLEDPVGGLSFYLCLDCYIMQKCDHAHNNLSRFLDNYSLLEAMDKSKLNEIKPQPESETRSRNLIETLLETVGTDKTSTMNELRISGTQTRSRPSETVQINKPSSSNHSHTSSPFSAPVQVPYRPTHNQNDQHLWSPSAPLAPLQNTAGPAVHNNTWITNNYSYQYHPPQHVQYPAASNAIVPQRQQWKIALGALNAAIYIGAIGSTLCSIL